MRAGAHPAQAELRLQRRSWGCCVTQFPGGFRSPNLPKGTGEPGKDKSLPVGHCPPWADPPSPHHGTERNYFPTKALLFFASPPPAPSPFLGLAVMGTGVAQPAVTLWGGDIPVGDAAAATASPRREFCGVGEQAGRDRELQPWGGAFLTPAAGKGHPLCHSPHLQGKGVAPAARLVAPTPPGHPGAKDGPPRRQGRWWWALSKGFPGGEGGHPGKGRTPQPAPGGDTSPERTSGGPGTPPGSTSRGLGAAAGAPQPFPTGRSWGGR